MKIINANDFEQKSKVDGLIAKLRQLATVDSAACEQQKVWRGFITGCA